MEIRRFIAIFIRRWPYFVIPFVAIPALVLLLCAVKTPVYCCSGKVLVQSTTKGNRLFTGLPEQYGTIDFSDASTSEIPSFKAILCSKLVVGEVLLKQNLRNTKGERYNVSDFVNPSPIALVLAKKPKGVGIARDGDADAFSVKGYSPDRNEAFAIAQGVVEEFGVALGNIHRRVARAAKSNIEARLREAKERMLAASAKLADSRAEGHSYNFETQFESLIKAEQALEADLNSSRRSAEESTRQLKAIMAGAGINSNEFADIMVRVSNTEAILEANKQLVVLQVSLANAQSSLTEDHSDVIAIKRKIASVEKFIESETKKTLASQITNRNAFFESLVTSYSSALMESMLAVPRQEVIKRLIVEKWEQIASLFRAEVTSRPFSAEDTVKETYYSTLLSDLEHVITAEQLDISNAVVIDQPELSVKATDDLYFPPSPKKKPLVILFSLFMGAFLGICSVFFIEYVDDRIWDPSTIPEACGLEVISGNVELPSRDAAGLVGESYPDGVMSLLLTWEAARGNASPPKPLLFVSTNSGECRSSLAALAARLLASQGLETLAVDADPVFCNLSRALGAPVETAALSGSADAAMAVRKCVQPHLWLVSAGGGNGVAGVGLAHAKDPLCKLLAEGPGYQAILLDAPSFASRRDALALASRTGALAVAVVLEGNSKHEELRSLAKAFSKASAPLLGVAFVRRNRVAGSILHTLAARFRKKP